ncbi:MAG: tRNA 2-selenouridine(34) synthase MnmH [Calditrichaeota bacterium]|nr:MAG: tRNA 2-selenouridine(34) synthase MnmH [Calditrichota bacterium]
MGMVNAVDIHQFLELAREHPVFDVRTPEEFEKGHIPGAYNLPLFSNEERAIVGTTYHRKGRQEAILAGLDLVGPKMPELVKRVKRLTKDNVVLLHCWRGGMRSNSVGWLLSLFDYEVYVLQGGYKAFRNFVLQTFEQPRKIVILSGQTGSGKTEVLQELRKMGEQVIDLEALARHKGSSFGSLGETSQPTQQQFENTLAMEWLALDSNRPVWLEDESQKIGSRMIPQSLWLQMRNTHVLVLEVPLELRAEHLMKEYGAFPKSLLIDSISRIQERLGGLHTRKAIELVETDQLRACCELLLSHYYDKAYRHGLSKRHPELIHRIPTDTINPTENAKKVLEAARRLEREWETSTMHS